MGNDETSESKNEETECNGAENIKTTEEDMLIPNDNDYWFVQNDLNPLRKLKKILQRVSISRYGYDEHEHYCSIENLTTTCFSVDHTTSVFGILPNNLDIELTFESENECKLKIFYLKDDKMFEKEFINPISFVFQMFEFFYPI